SRRRHTRSVSAFLLNRSSDLQKRQKCQPATSIQGSNVPNPDEAVPSFVSGAMAKAGKGLLEGTLQAGTSAVSDKLLDLVGLGGKIGRASCRERVEISGVGGLLVRKRGYRRRRGGRRCLHV